MAYLPMYKGLRANRCSGDKKFCSLNEIPKAVSTNEHLFTTKIFLTRINAKGRCFFNFSLDISSLGPSYIKRAEWRGANSAR
jgi:hypothetical protein